MLGPERGQVGSRYHLPLDLLAVAPDDLDERQRERPFDAAGKAWVRFAVWDSAGNGAFVQPVWLR